MGEKKWKDIDWDQCSHCGNEIEVFTDEIKKGWVIEGDSARCKDCQRPGYVDVYEEQDSAYIEWHDEPDCECDWCKENPPE